MDPRVLEQWNVSAWAYLAFPVLVLCAVVLTVRLGAPQWTKFGAGLRGLRAKSEGGMSAALGLSLSTAASFGAAAAIGAATAVSLGGAGVLPWIWLFGIVLAPIRYAETLFSRTDAPGRGDAAQSGSIPRRLFRGGYRVVGGLLVLLIALTALFFVSGVHGSALKSISTAVMPDNSSAVLFVVAGISLVIGAMSVVQQGNPRGALTIVGWVAAVSLIIVFVCGAWGALSDPSRAIAALGRSFSEAISGVDPATPFVGAVAGEVAFAAMLHLLPPLATATGVSSVAHAETAAKTRPQAAVAVLGPFFYAVLTSALVVTFVGSGAYYTLVDDKRPLTETLFYKSDFATPTERTEAERFYSGYVRIRSGANVDPSVRMGTDRGMVRESRFEYYGETADLAFEVVDGAPRRMMRNESRFALKDLPVSQARYVDVVGEMLPRGGKLVALGMERSTGGGFASNLLFTALLLLAGIAAGMFGASAARALPADAPKGLRFTMAALPAVGLLVLALGAPAWWQLIGALCAAHWVVITSGVLVWRSGEIANL